MERQLTNEQQVREQVQEALKTIRPLVTMSRDGLVITALEWGAARHAAYETATAAAAAGDLELREQGSGDVPTIEAVTRTKPVVIFAGDTVVGGKQNRIINVTVWLPAAAIPAGTFVIANAANDRTRYRLSRSALSSSISSECGVTGRWSPGPRRDRDPHENRGVPMLESCRARQHNLLCGRPPARQRGNLDLLRRRQREAMRIRPGRQPHGDETPPLGRRSPRRRAALPRSLEQVAVDDMLQRLAGGEPSDLGTRELEGAARRTW
jgi:hypothetical protein